MSENEILEQIKILEKELARVRAEIYKIESAILYNASMPVSAIQEQ
jgi:cob(I)alamin adenosyltransferase